jgi:hypothetical protein
MEGRIAKETQADARRFCVLSVSAHLVHAIAPITTQSPKPHKKRGDPARTSMARFAVSHNVNENNTSLMIMHEYTRRHVHVTSLDLT